MLSKEIFRGTKNLLETRFNEDINDLGSVNKLLKKTIVVLLLVAGTSSLISYTFVLSKENELQNLHSQTTLAEMDMIDLKTDVDFTKSLYNVHEKAKSITYLHKPEKVMEIDLDKMNLDVDLDENQPECVDRIVAGY